VRLIASPRPALAVVLHANQYLISGNYADRQGLVEIVAGYQTVLDLHVRHAITASLHLSGTLIEALAWHQPEFLVHVRDIYEAGLIDLIGGTYSENPMPCFSPDFNVRQLEEWWRLAELHLGLRGEPVTTAWVPERIWDTAALAPVLVECGYQNVLLDDRHLLERGRRPDFDRDLAGQVQAGTLPVETSLRPHAIRGGAGLVAIPISSHLRYWLPPAEGQGWDPLVAATRALPGDALLTFADDLERIAGVGGWDPGGPVRYESALRQLAHGDAVRPVLLSHWLADARPATEVEVEPGTYHELASLWQAGDDYQGWWENPDWLPYREHLLGAEAAVREAERAGADPALVELAWKHLLASSYEAGWHDPEPGGGPGRAPAAWVRALAHHARASIVIAAAATWFGGSSAGSCPSFARLWDVDGDGTEDVVLADATWFAVLSPGHGGRLVALFAHENGRGRLVVGNPSDDWNLQQELNRYMDFPANHPGALVDVGFEHDLHCAESVACAPARVRLVNAEPDSSLRGTQKTIALDPRLGVVVSYRLPPGVHGLAVEVAAAPDYLTVLREGVKSADLDWTPDLLLPLTGCAAGGSDLRSAGHAVCLRIEAHSRAFDFALRRPSVARASRLAARRGEVA